MAGTIADMIAPNRLHLVADPPTSADATSWPDAGLLLFLFATHAMPVIALAMGRSWGVGVEGYGTVVALVTGRELVREVWTNLRACAVRLSRA